MSLRIIFMGTPEFAIPSLVALHESEHEVVAVITATDKLGGRGQKQRLESAVKRYARTHDIPVLQPPNLKARDFIDKLRSYQADLQVVVAFRMLPEVVWAMPRLGTINLHGSLLPKYRGAAPIHWAVISGETITGVTTFFIQQKIDTGNILLQEAMPIHPEDTTGDVHDRMMYLGASTVLKSVALIEQGGYDLLPQNHNEATHAPKLFHETCEILTDQPVAQVYNFVRGLNPFPGAWTTLDGQEVKLYGCLPVDDPGAASRAGQWYSDGKKDLRLYVADGYLLINDLKMSGRRRMDTTSFLNGYNLEASDIQLLPA